MKYCSPSSKKKKHKNKHDQSFKKKFMPVFLRLQQIIQDKEIHETVLFIGDQRNDSFRENCQKKKLQRMIDLSTVIR